ncbi:MAG: hypothetical protein HOV96_40965 [Nonomuraea sp.]|nr:hypothetical protein [Nonomuraea sp.]NUR71112.1 hypothetical protein [Hamadaea sp.]
MTATDRPRHRFRYWPAPQDEEPLPEPAPVTMGHTHEQRKLPFVIAYVGLALLAIAVGFLLIYVLGRGQYRDQQDARIQEQIRQRICSVLDSLPEGGLLDRSRHENGCGPGTPISDYPPAVQDQLRTQRGAAASPTVTVPPAPEPASPEPVAPYVTPTFDLGGAAPPTSSPPTAPTTSPTTEPNPLLDTVCDLAGVCLEVPAP